MTDPHGVAYDPHVFFTLMKRLHVHACDDWPGASAAVFKKSRSSASQAPLLCGGKASKEVTHRQRSQQSCRMAALLLGEMRNMGVTAPEFMIA